MEDRNLLHSNVRLPRSNRNSRVGCSNVTSNLNSGSVRTSNSNNSNNSNNVPISKISSASINSVPGSNSNNKELRNNNSVRTSRTSSELINNVNGNNASNRISSSGRTNNVRTISSAGRINSEFNRTTSNGSNRTTIGSVDEATETETSMIASTLNRNSKRV